MQTHPYQTASFDKSDPVSIYNYSSYLIGNSLHSLLGDEIMERERDGKGRLGQMVEELFFHYDVNSNRAADFSEAGLELKCTPLLESKTDGSYRIKERLVCTMIDYFEVSKTNFEDSHLLAKCQLMLLLFYLHSKDLSALDYRFLYRVLWQLPEKDLLQIKKDYDTIAAKVQRGEAHLLSEGDTVYLGACRKGQKGDALQKQPFSSAGAKKRAFSLKPAYMRYVLDHVVNSGTDHYSNFQEKKKEQQFELVTADELKEKSFEDIIVDRFRPFIGKDYVEICEMLGREAYQSKSKYADIAGLIASENKSKRIASAEEFVKSGITMKTIRLGKNGLPEESMSFKNIDYNEVADNDDWEESEAYELFTTRFMFVVFKEVDRTISVVNRKKNEVVTEKAYVLDKVFFWTMPADDLEVAREFWEDIRKNVVGNTIELKNFWSIANHKKFHVRPKGTKENNTTAAPSGDVVGKYCYWFNADYVNSIIGQQE